MEPILVYPWQHSTVLHCRQLQVGKQWTVKALFHLHGNNGYPTAPQYYVIRVLPILSPSVTKFVRSSYGKAQTKVINVSTHLLLKLFLLRVCVGGGVDFLPPAFFRFLLGFVLNLSLMLMLPSVLYFQLFS
jgi:hypothetical protein